MEGSLIFGLGTTHAKQLFCNNYTITPVVRWCLEEILGMTDYQLNVNFHVLLNSGGYFERPNLVYVSQHLDTLTSFRALFHELRHFYQYQTGMFDFNAKSFMRELPADMPKERQDLERYLEYLEYPWELDATDFAMKTSSRFWQSSVSSSFSASSTSALYPALGRR